MSRRAEHPLAGLRRLGSRAVRSAGLWAALFGLTIPAMALYYTALGEGAFRDSNLQLEAGFRADVKRLERSLTQAIDAPLAARHNTWTQDGTRFTFKAVPEVSVVVPVPSSQRHLAIRITGLWESRHAAGNVAQWFDIGLPDELRVVEHHTESAIYRAQPTGAYGVGASAPSPADVPEPVLLPTYAPAEAPALKVPPSVAGELLNVDRGYEGDPAVASDEFWRMVYFSATTITTLGLGDIQPISDEARTAVTIEAALGIFLAGMFLAALARRIAHEGPKRRKE